MQYNRKLLLNGASVGLYIPDADVENQHRRIRVG
jgi:hypothetical protein